MTPEEKIERGVRAQALLESDFFKETFRTLEASYIEAWKESKTVEAREDAHKYVRLIEWFRADVTKIAHEGVVSKHRVDALKGAAPYGTLAEFLRD